MNKNAQLKNEILSFKNMWEGGYYEGDPMDSMSYSSYNVWGYMSILHVTYLICVKPYITKDTIALEIGPGRGAWTRTMLDAKEIWCLDALSAEHNNFWKYVGYHEKIKYIQVNDFSCSDLPNEHFDYLFTFGTFCHISFDGITNYMKAVYPKLKKGAHGFLMIADYDKFNNLIENNEKYSIISILRPKNKIKRWIWNLQWKITNKYDLPTKRYYKDEDSVPKPGRWYHAGLDKTCEMLEKIGYKIIEKDIGVIYRDPIIHIIK